MSTRHNTVARLLAWARKRTLLITASLATLGLVVAIFVNTYRLYDARRAQVRALCEATNDTNDTVRFILSAALRQRSPDNPISPGLRQAYVDAFKRLPVTDCGSGEKTYFDPPFPPGA